ncbi:hypothetical protein [Edaphobacter flagellatus]|uniref:hypothetical protein n=1 Tax=Edaphobacter flagellatus TaxID=1933044 RepID=UPI0021B3FD47|nr:hypothetical protein [Edaphobacter flagellatus]
MQRPKNVAAAILVLIVLQMAFLDYWGYSHAYHSNPDTFMDVVTGTGSAPSQYRIGVLWPASFIMHHSPLGLRHILTAIDLIAGLIAVFVLFSLLERFKIYRDGSIGMQWFGAATFALLVQFYLPWVTWYQRPETMTTTALVALMLLTLTVRVPIAGWAGILATAAVQLLLAAAQSFVRTDVTVAFYAGVLLACMVRGRDDMSLPRYLEMAVSGLAILMAGGIQYYMSHIVFPQATYGDTPIFQLVLQFKEPARLIAFALFIPPYVWLIRTLIRRRIELNGASTAIVLGSAIFMGMWWLVGRVEEVRIFLPFAMAVAPLTAATGIKVWLSEQAA